MKTITSEVKGQYEKYRCIHCMQVYPEKDIFCDCIQGVENGESVYYCPKCYEPNKHWLNYPLEKAI